MNLLLRYFGLFFFVSSHLFLAFQFLFDPNIDLKVQGITSFEILWFLGIMSVLTLFIYSLSLRSPIWVFSLLLIFGIVWTFIPLIFTFFGIPFLIIYLVFGSIIYFKSKIILS
ncbi:hypothetical protein [Flammeovirga sp. SJP92]|uniref:hypothetical protein n=1 Tax=Flammeovirga sp. SJP92 TaxID=1775430 RepID=UPI0007990F0C|nr:hypothetical protein [Flammeovirga sp. SJP92]KXX66699.1 hypothetical protein AVL50_31145 [Flammeovirga sp. SJP92]